VANGAAYKSTPCILRELGADVTVIHDEPNGTNINAECGSTFPSAIQRAAKESRARIGITHDGDADRVLLCDEKGELVDGDEILAIAAVDLLKSGVRTLLTISISGSTGAGKTTFVKMLLAAVHPTSGKARIFGRDAADPEARRPIGYLPENHRFPRYLSGRQVDEFGQHAVGAGAAVVFPVYRLCPEVRYPTALEECYMVARWVARHGQEHGLDAGRLAVAGDSVGGNMATVITLLSRERGGPDIRLQLLFYPVTDAAFDTASYHQFAEGYHLRRDAMMWFWDQYTRHPGERNEITASPLRASVAQLQGLPAALIITAEADVLRDEGEAYANKLRQAGVRVTAVRFQGTIHDFVMLNALAHSAATRGAIALATAWLREGFAARLA